MSKGDMTDAGIDDMKGLVRPAEEEAVNLGWERGWGREHEVIVSGSVLVRITRRMEGEG